MTSKLHLLVVEGNTAETRSRHAAVSGSTPSEAYTRVLRWLAPDAVINICFPADPGAETPGDESLSSFDGVVITGSALNLWKGEDAALRQVELAKRIFAAQVPFFGSCWGLQVASVAAGGKVALNPRGREIGIARKITLTEAGRTHAMHLGRPIAFDAPAVHMDEVAVLPADITVTAANSISQVQAAEIRFNGGVFWGVQYHPEYSLFDIAATVTRYGSRLVQEGFYRSLDELETHMAVLKTLDRDPSRRDLSWQYGIDQDLLDARARTTEIANWLKQQASRRSASNFD